MKKLFSILLVLTMLLCTACGGTSTDSGKEGNGSAPASTIFSEVTGLPMDETAMIVDGNEIPTDLYLYWVATIASNMEYQISMYNTYYGMYGELLNEDMSVNWDAEFTAGQTLGEYVGEQVINSAAGFAVIENMAASYDLTQSEAAAATVESVKTTAIEQLGSEEAFLNQLSVMGIDEELFTRVTVSSYYSDALTSLVMEEGSPLYLDKADYNEYSFYADHILLSTVDTETREPLDEATIAEKHALAEDLLAQLRASDDPVTLFQNLADEHSEDPGRATNPSGYVYTSGTMVTEFEDAVKALDFGQISDIVESSYGYHIILRRDLNEALDASPEQKAEIASQHLSSLIQLQIDQAEITVEDVVSQINIGEFYNAYLTASEAKQAELSEDTPTNNTATDASAATTTDK
ncbi:MAG: peptidylprolyl isomerase [Oscillospiraceae bacterium]|nr:peptidylprolyl isomerase [Oscillospiraceae bacterium]